MGHGVPAARAQGHACAEGQRAQLFCCAMCSAPGQVLCVRRQHVGAAPPQGNFRDLEVHNTREGDLELVEQRVSVHAAVEHVLDDRGVLQDAAQGGPLAAVVKGLLVAVNYVRKFYNQARPGSQSSDRRTLQLSSTIAVRPSCHVQGAVVTVCSASDRGPSLRFAAGCPLLVYCMQSANTRRPARWHAVLSSAHSATTCPLLGVHGQSATSAAHQGCCTEMCTSGTLSCNCST